MGRKQKNNASYFPHDAGAAGGDTCTILQSKYKNDGYAFWFKLLEKLTATDNHYLNLQNPTKWQTFIAKMGVDEITTVEIMDLLVVMDNIDKELWKSRVVWCQNLVDNLEDVYKNRRREMPQKPITTSKNGVTTVEKDINIVETPEMGVEIPQSKVNKSKVEKSKVNNNSNVFLLYEQEIGKLTQTISSELTELQNEYPYSELSKAIKIAVTNNKRSLAYIKGILNKGGKKDAPASLLEGLEE